MVSDHWSPRALFQSNDRIQLGLFSCYTGLFNYTDSPQIPLVRINFLNISQFLKLGGSRGSLKWIRKHLGWDRWKSSWAVLLVKRQVVLGFVFGRSCCCACYVATLCTGGAAGPALRKSPWQRHSLLPRLLQVNKGNFSSDSPSQVCVPASS